MKDNEKTWRMIKIIFVIVVSIVGVVFAYGVLTQKVTTNSSNIKEAKSDIDTNQQAIITNQQSIVELKTDVKYIKFGIDDIKEELKK